MRKILSLFLVFLFTVNSALAFSVDTTGWADKPELVSVSASEMDLKSDLKNDFRVFQTTITNNTDAAVDIIIPSNKIANDSVEKLIASGLSFKELMAVPAQLATDSYKEDVGQGTVAKAHKSLICVLATAGAVAAGAGFLGMYPQQKTEEFFAHKKMRKEYKKISKNVICDLTLPPLEQADVLLFVPIDYQNPLLIINSRNDASDVYTDYHQL